MKAVPTGKNNVTRFSCVDMCVGVSVLSHLGLIIIEKVIIFTYGNEEIAAGSDK